ncbi:Cytochrome c oxidase copper chaperone [Coemansia erecta]|nr:Cytochrome c oxidase copper chaperone [Coemansia sp. RSA 2618]KAJ2820943.1 Cytochrome c oxidase copper chaperone [Coemansia erecta]
MDKAAKPSGDTAKDAKKVKPCCVCLETKKARDMCYLDHGDSAESKCHYLIAAHRQCMAEFGFKI